MNRKQLLKGTVTIIMIVLFIAVIGCQPGLPTTTSPAIEQNDTILSDDNIVQQYPDGLEEALEELEMVR